jgi:hypothetical protein
MLPLQVNADVSNAVIAAVHVTSVPANHFLTAEQIAQLQQPLLIDHEQHEPEIISGPSKIISDEPAQSDDDTGGVEFGGRR